MTDTRTIPTIGRIVHYALSEFDAQQINKRVIDGVRNSEKHREDSDGSIVHIGNGAYRGQICPAIIVRLNGANVEASVNLQVFIDGNHTHWAPSRTQGDLEGQFFFPVVTR